MNGHTDGTDEIEKNVIKNVIEGISKRLLAMKCVTRHKMCSSYHRLHISGACIESMSWQKLWFFSILFVSY